MSTSVDFSKSVLNALRTNAGGILTGDGQDGRTVREKIDFRQFPLLLTGHEWHDRTQSVPDER